MRGTKPLVRQNLSLRMGQTLAMTPALQQAIRLLQLSTLDLQTEIQQALDSNLMLERIEEEGAAPIDEVALRDENAAEKPTSDETPVSGELDLEIWSDSYDGAPHRDAEAEAELYEYRQASLHANGTLRDHLLWQAGLCSFNERDAEIAAHLVDAVNEDGYLDDWEGVSTRLLEMPGIDTDDIDRVLALVQDFDPPGVAARDLSECLRLQLQQHDCDDVICSAALRIVDKHMAELARQDENLLCRVTGLDRERLQQAVAVIQSLQPHPGRPYAGTEPEYIVPDVFVVKKSGRWQVSLNPEIAPRVRINRHYMGLIRRADNSSDQQTLKQHLQEARYFLNSLKSRNETLLRVATRIIEEQRAFLDYGDEAMRPLVLRDVAENLGIHESTVSRATANKYMLTPRGLYELKYFFSSHVRTTQGGTCSATAIQAMIKRLVGQETPDKPLSDATLSTLLLKDGIQVARRTVAKYREALGIPAAHERRRMA